MSSRSSVNMLRTRRRDNNVKPNRRLDRKSSRGMIYENEELRLRTININAEIERGQYDIKKLKRENELLKKEIWCLRDEYEKLDKLLKDKEIDFSSSSTTSESDSCSSCMDESDDVEKNQNLENVHKSTVNNLNRAFETLSVVPEESTENSDNTSNRISLVNEQLPHDNDVIQADQSYPRYDQAPTLRLMDASQNSPKQFFSLDRLAPNPTAPYQDGQTIYPNEYYGDNAGGNRSCCDGQEMTTQCTSRKIVHTDATNIYQNIVLVPKPTYLESETLEKRATDILVKTDNRNFLQDHEPNGDGYIAQFGDDFPRFCANFGTNSHSTFSNGGNLEELLNDIETISQDILAISNTNQNDYYNPTRRCKSDIDPADRQGNPNNEKPFKSELNVTLMPQPMALIGLEKYREIQRSMNSTPSKSLENLSDRELHVFHNQDDHVMDKREFHHFQQSPTEISDFVPIHTNRMGNPVDTPSPKITQNPNFSAYLRNLKDNYVNGDYFARYNPDYYQANEKTTHHIQDMTKAADTDQRDQKPKTLVKQVPIDVPSCENDENSKTKLESQMSYGSDAQKNDETEKTQPKPKIGLRKKVSIHFRGKKEKQKKSIELPSTSIKQQSPVRDKKPPTEVEPEEPKSEKSKTNHQKTSSKDSVKTTSESDAKTNGDARKTADRTENYKKLRKSESVSPDRRKLKEEKKCKKHKKDRMRLRRATLTSLDSRDHRARSHSVTTDRSNQFFYEEYMLNSERDSMSSCDTLKTRQMNFTNIPIAGKVPWCGCWGNGCI